jgi:hypothetical protein
VAPIEKAGVTMSKRKKRSWSSDRWMMSKRLKVEEGDVEEIKEEKVYGNAKPELNPELSKSNLSHDSDQ